MDIIKFYGILYRDNTHFMETERVIKQLEYQLGLYIIFCISKAEVEFPEKSCILGTDGTTFERVRYYLKKKIPSDSRNGQK